ncbi:MAG: hypothetical protein R2778_02810 [Saprospiraceae bacterium]
MKDIMQQDNYSHLIEKLDAFIRKFYINQLLRGALYTVGAVLGLFILLNIAEYYLYFGTTTRTVLLWGFLGFERIRSLSLGGIAAHALFPPGESDQPRTGRFDHWSALY